MFWNRATATLVFLAVTSFCGTAYAAARPTAIFPVELLDTSGEAAKPGQAERLALATKTLAEGIERTGRYKSVDLSPFAEQIAATEPRYNCNACWREVAKEAGAELAVIAVVHKISTLISTVNIYVADLASGDFVAKANGQFRGDDDRAYVRAFTFLVEERLAAQPQAAD
jgi:hypothetical protein